MAFSSLIFLFHSLPLFLLLHYICPAKWKNAVLFAGSLIFYIYGVKNEPWYFFLFLLSILVNYHISLLLGRRRWLEHRKRWLAFGLCYNLIWLFLFRYSGFFVGNLNWIFKKMGIGFSIQIPEFSPPVGINFYIFQVISYLADIYRKDVLHETSFIGYGTYITMFPQLIAGPIVTYASVRKQIHQRNYCLKNVENGLWESTIGLRLKVFLTNQVGRLWSQVGAIGYESISTPFAWLGLAAFSFQIYFGFCSYSLTAKGLGQLMGSSLPDNFNCPHLSLSMIELWHRWYMTLGGWFRDYIYTPLGGNRCGKATTIHNMLVVRLLTGLWHGVSWNSILWGGVTFLLMLIERMGLKHLLDGCPLIGHLYMIMAIPLTWLSFAVTDLVQMKIRLLCLFPFLALERQSLYFAGDFLKYGRIYVLSLTLSLIFTTQLPRKLYRQWKRSFLTAVILLAVFWLCAYLIKMGADGPFLYFRFQVRRLQL